MPPAKNDMAVKQDNARKNVHRSIRNLAVLKILALKGNNVLMNTGGICTYVAEGLRLAVRPRLAPLRHHRTSESQSLGNLVFSLDVQASP